MQELSNSQYKQAFDFWFRKFPEREIDFLVIPFLANEIKSPQPRDWLRRARRATFLSTGQVAEKLGITRTAYAKFEKKELEGRITLEKMEELAKALDCEFVYAIRPKSRMRFSVNVWRKLLPHAERHCWFRSRALSMKPNALGAIATRLTNDPEFRRQNGWGERF